jgi:hypothetical protein
VRSRRPGRSPGQRPEQADRAPLCSPSNVGTSGREMTTA